MRFKSHNSDLQLWEKLSFTIELYIAILIKKFRMTNLFLRILWYKLNCEIQFVLWTFLFSVYFYCMNIVILSILFIITVFYYLNYMLSALCLYFLYWKLVTQRYIPCLCASLFVNYEKKYTIVRCKLAIARNKVRRVRYKLEMFYSISETGFHSSASQTCIQGKEICEMTK